MENIIVLIMVAICFILLIQHLRKIAKGDEGCQGCFHQKNCKG